MMIMDAIVLAGGLGTRLQPVISDIPKPMAPVAGKPFLEYILEWLKCNMVSRVILAVGYQWEVIREAFGSRFGQMELIYSVEDTPLGTGGAIRQAMTYLRNEKCFIVNGDTFCRACLSQLFAFHHAAKFDLSLLLKPMPDTSRYGLVEIDDKQRITRFSEKQPGSEGLINSGIYLANSIIKQYFPDKEAFSFEKEFLETQLNHLSFGGLVSESYFIDIGIPDDYQKAQTELPNLEA